MCFRRIRLCTNNNPNSRSGKVEILFLSFGGDDGHLCLFFMIKNAALSYPAQNIMLPLQSRFFVVNLELYTYEQFYQITAELLTKWHKVKAIELETYQNSHPDYNIENARKGIDLFRNNIDWRIEALNEKYHAILEDYDFPLHVIKEIIG